MRTFKEMWEFAQNYGACIEDIAKELYTCLINEGQTEDTIQMFMNLLCELKGLDDYLSENKLDADKLPWILRHIRDHKHVDGQVVLPMVIDP
jgi:hypothetical protein